MDTRATYLKIVELNYVFFFYLNYVSSCARYTTEDSIPYYLYFLVQSRVGSIWKKHDLSSPIQVFYRKQQTPEVLTR